MREHRIYYGKFKTEHYFVEVKKKLFAEWNKKDVDNITHKDIVKWNLQERRGSKSRTLLMRFNYFKRGCGDTIRLIKTIS